MSIKGVVLIGGPHKGTRFRPLSLDIPKPLFPVAGFPVIYHHLEALSKVEGITEICLLGFYQQNGPLAKFLTQVTKDFHIPVRYLQEYTPLGTAGGIYHFRDLIFSGNTDTLIVLHSDVCCDFGLEEMVQFHRKKNGKVTVMSTEAIRSQSLHYGNVVYDSESHQLLHYVEKPETFVSNYINCGIYIMSNEVIPIIKQILKSHMKAGSDGFVCQTISFEREILHYFAVSNEDSPDTAYVYVTNRFWSQIKSAGAAIYANRHYLEMYRQTCPRRLADHSTIHRNLSTLSTSGLLNGHFSIERLPTITGDVYVHPSAKVDRTAKLGPNVSIGKNAVIGAGCRVRESIVLDGAQLGDNCCVLNAIIGWSSSIGTWSRIEGTPNDPNPNKPYAKLEMLPLFSDQGRLNPSITLIGSNVIVAPEIIVLNSVVLPDKDLVHDCKNQIVL